jgi:hypothetical protein
VVVLDEPGSQSSPGSTKGTDMEVPFVLFTYILGAVGTIVLFIIMHGMYWIVFPEFRGTVSWCEGCKTVAVMTGVVFIVLTVMHIAIYLSHFIKVI